MSEFDSFLDKQPGGEFDSFLDAGKPQKQKNQGLIGDIGTGLKVGVERLPGMVTGLADLAAAPVSKLTGINRPFSRAADWAGEQTGFQPEKWANEAQGEYSDQYRQAQQEVESADGFLPTVGALARNPRFALGTVVESAPSMIAGMGVGGAGAKLALGAEKLAALRAGAAAGDTAAATQLGRIGAVAGGVGEGAITAGQHMGQLDYDIDPMRAAGTALASGAATGMIGAASGRLASKMGLTDIDAAAVTGLGQRQGVQGMLKRAAQGALTEGVLEELPQSMQEQIWQNVATGRPWNEGVAEQGAIGMVAGSLMGGGINLMSRGPRGEAAPIQHVSPENENTPYNAMLSDGPGMQGSLFEDDGTGHYTPLNNAELASDATVFERLDSLKADRQELASYVDAMMQAQNYPAAQQALGLLHRVEQQIAGVTSLLADEQGQMPGRMQIDGSQMGIDFAPDRPNPLTALRAKNLLVPNAEQADLFGAALYAEDELGSGNGPLMAHAGVGVPGTFNYNLGLPTTQQQLLEEEGSYDQSTPMATGSRGKQRGVAGGSNGNIPAQPGLGGRVGADAGASLERSGANPSVGTGAGVGGAALNATQPAQVATKSQKANGTQDAATTGFNQKQLTTWNKAVAELGANHPDLDGINQTISNNKLGKALKDIEEAKAGSARTLAEKLLASLPKGRKGKVAKEGVDYSGVLATYVGFDGTGDEKLEAVAKAHGYKDRQAAYNIIYGHTTKSGNRIPGAVERLKDFAVSSGYTAEQARQAIIDLGFSRNNQYGWSEDQKEIASLTGALETGIESPNQGKLDFRDAAQQGMLSRELQADPVTAAATTSDESVSQEVLDVLNSTSGAADAMGPVSLDGPVGFDDEKVKGTEEERGLTVEEIRAKRAAEAQAKADAKGGSLEEEKPRESTAAPKYNFSPEEYAKAESLYNDWADDNYLRDDEKPIAFSELDQDIRDALVRETLDVLNAPTAKVNFTKLDKATEFLIGEQRERQAKRSSERTTGEAGSDLQEGGNGTGFTEQEEVVQPTGGTSQSEEVTEEAIVSRWNQGAKALGVSGWEGLSSEQRNYILGSGTWEEFDEAAAEVYDEINDDQGASKFSEGSAEPSGNTKQNVTSTLKATFMGSGRFDALVTVFQSHAEIPADLKGKAAADANMSVADVPWGQVQGFALDGRVYMVADGIQKGDELGVFLHEIGVHVGMEKLVGKENMKWLASQVDHWAKGSGVEAEIAREAVERANESASENREEEKIAYFVEAAVKAGINPQAIKPSHSFYHWFRRLWAAAKSALRQLGFKNPDKFTGQHLVDLAMGAARIEIAGTWHGTAADFRKFDHSYMGSGEGAQAFGWGTYLAQRAGIAKGYWKDDVRRKRKGGSEYDQVFIDGKAIHQTLGFDNDAFYFEVDMLNGNETSEQLKQAVLTQIDQQIRQVEWSIREVKEPEGIDEEERLWREEYKARRREELDGLRAAKVSVRMMHSDRFGFPPKNDVEGSLMRVDTAVHEDEMLDWDKPLSEQSELVKNALGSMNPAVNKKDIEKRSAEIDDYVDYETVNKYGETEERGIYNGNEFTLTTAKQFSGGVKVSLRVEDMRGNVLHKGVFTSRKDALEGAAEWQLSQSTKGLIEYDHSGEAMYRVLEKQLGSDKAASEYLDSIGIKGIKFLDSKSRGTLPDVKFVGNDNLGRNRLLRDFLVYMRRTNGDFTASVQLMRDKFDVPVGSPKRDTVSVSVSNFLAFIKQSDFEVSRPNQTRNLVIFNDKNINRVTTQVGASRDRIKFSQAKQQTKQYEAAAKSFWDTVKGRFTGAHKLAMPWMFAHQLQEHASKFLPENASKYFKAVSDRMMERIKAERNVAAIADKFHELDAATQNKINSFLYDSTSSQKWAYVPSWDKTAKVDSDMAQRFNALPAEAREIIQGVFEHGHKQLRELEDAINDSLPEGTKKIKRAEMQGPYAPLKRFGKYVIVGKSKAYQQAELNDDRKTLEKLRSDENHYYVEFKDSETMARMRHGDLAAQMPDLEVKMVESSEELKKHNELGFQTFKKLETLINNDKMAAKYKATMSNLAQQLYVHSLASMHARKSEIRRRNVAGADTDMMKSFIAQGQAEASLLSVLRTDADTQDALQGMRDEAKRGDKQHEKSVVLNEIFSRHMEMLAHNPTPAQDKVLKLSSIGHLLLSPAYYLTNMTQPALVSLPVISGRHGIATSSSALTGAFKNLWSAKSLFKRGGFNLDALGKMEGSVGNELEALKELIARNHLDTGMEIDLGDATNRSSLPGMKQIDSFINKLHTLVRGIETVNRMSTALAAYRLEYTKQLNDKATPEAAHAAATEYADKIVVDTHGDYSGHNAPRMFMQANKPLPVKVMAQFKKYQLIQIGLLTKMVREGFINDNTDEGKKEARAALRYVLSTQLAVAGVMGLPVGSLVMALAGAGAEDGEDKEAYLRKVLGPMAPAVLKGIPAALGVDVSGRLGMGNVFNPLPFVDNEKKGKDQAKEYAFALFGGAAGAYGLKIADAIGELDKGHYWRGIELAMPNGLLTNLSKVARYESEGVTTRRGDVVMKPDEVSLMTDVAQLLGFPTTALTDRQWRSGVLFQTEQGFKDRVSELKERYVDAHAAKDSAELAAVRQEWMEMQTAKRNLGFKMNPLSDLVKAPMEKAKRERDVVNGVQATKSNRKFVESLPE